MVAGFLLLGTLAAQTTSEQTDTFIMVNPDSIIRIGFDLDGDNRIDAYENVRGYDLMRNSPRLRQHLQEDAGAARPAEPMPLISLRGEIRDLKQVRLTGMPQRHIIARIETEEDRSVAVDLGPKSQINSLELEKGDWISVRGIQGSINRNKMLMAAEIQTADQAIRVNQPPDRNELRFAGKIRETTVRSIGADRPDHLLALVETPQDEKVVVDLGSNAALQQQDVELSRNDEIVFLARPARFAGKNLLAVTQLSVDGKIVDVGRRDPLY